ncbi:type II toxin-antitoxin system ParD family antitoxin [Oscillatoria sp. FACHB-1407]|uniref:ribbon-helix-helix domain-containing protein n=1 Tax=Oscillatoria sp. FACHB-1407 TaxID=2692847 RepID=UPI0016873742|nr:type II toxin-antitoxin system ParD family antitoxin [Oscillatoria sp. FACHB-1407]MBD2460670.1 type II toxin-antitoxin system ParD family antitoxin [Oscillatoria sp. FACHB-1407]
MLNVTLPDQILAFVEEQATAAGFSTVNEYIYHLILREQERIAQQEQIESLLLEGLDSGEPVEVTDDWWTQKRDQLVEQVHQSDT